MLLLEDEKGKLLLFPSRYRMPLVNMENLCNHNKPQNLVISRYLGVCLKGY